MKERILAARYAKGLVEASLETGEIMGLMDEARLLKDAAELVPDMVRAFSDERVPMERRLAAARAVGKSLGLGRMSLDATLLLIQKGRAALLPMVAEEAMKLIAAREGITMASLAVADGSVAERIRGDVEELIGRAFTKNVSLGVKVDPSLIGGFKLKVGDVSVDASVAGKLARMRQLLGDGSEDL